MVFTFIPSTTEMHGTHGISIPVCNLSTILGINQLHRYGSISTSIPSCTADEESQDGAKPTQNVL
jgi:hypothetical protein